MTTNPTHEQSAAADRLHKLLANIPPGHAEPCFLALGCAGALPWCAVPWIACESGVEIVTINGTRHFHRPATGADL